MDNKQLNNKVDLTLASLDEVSPCIPSRSFLNRVLSSASEPAQESEQIGWWPNLAMTMVIMLLLLDVAALIGTWKIKNTEVQTQILREISFESHGTQSSFFLAELDEKLGGF